MNIIEERVKTPPPKYTQEEIQQQRKDLFENKNPTLFYVKDLFDL